MYNKFQKCKKNPDCIYCSSKKQTPANNITSIVISLETDEKRRNNAELELHKTGLCKRGGFWIAKRHSKGGVHGCIESHLEVIKYLSSMKLEYGLILEDDIKFLESDITPALEKLEKVRKYDKDWQLFYLGWFSPIKPSWNMFYSSIDTGIIKGGFESTHSYFISETMMNEIKFHTIDLPIDEYYCKNFSSHSYGIYPLFTVQDDRFQSNIQTSSKSEAWNLTSSKLCYTLGLNHGVILLILITISVIILCLIVIIIYKRYKKKNKTKIWILG